MAYKEEIIKWGCEAIATRVGQLSRRLPLEEGIVFYRGNGV